MNVNIICDHCHIRTSEYYYDTDDGGIYLCDECVDMI